MPFFTCKHEWDPFSESWIKLKLQKPFWTLIPDGLRLLEHQTSV